MKLRLRGLVGLGFLGIAGGCGELLEPDVLVDEEPRWAHSEACSWDAPTPVPVGAPFSPTHDINGEWAEIARRVPGGWGGHFRANGFNVMYLREPPMREAAIEALATEDVRIATNVVVREGRWDFAELYDWYRFLNPDVFGLEGVTMAGIQEDQNRILYGAIDESTRETAEAVLKDLGVPCFLVAIEIHEYAIAAY